MNGATQTAYDELMSLARQRAATGGKTPAQEFSDLLTTRPDLRRRLGRERLAERQVAATPSEDGGRGIAQAYLDAVATQARIDNPRLTEAQAAVKAFDSLSPLLRRVLAGGR